MMHTFHDRIQKKGRFQIMIKFLNEYHKYQESYYLACEIENLMPFG